MLAAICGVAQQPSSDPGMSQSPSGQNSPGQGARGPGPSTKPPGRSTSSPAARDQQAEESSSRDTRTDLSPPKDDAKNHPDSQSAVEGLVPSLAGGKGSSGDQFQPWDPLKSAKDVEVGDFYFRRKNYKAALDRYKEALYYKDNDAAATYHIAVCHEKLGDKAEARKYFEQYLKILPEGPLAREARASLERLDGHK